MEERWGSEYQKEQRKKQGEQEGAKDRTERIKGEKEALGTVVKERRGCKRALETASKERNAILECHCPMACQFRIARA